MTEDYQDHLFDSTIAFDESPEALAAYIEAGGDIDTGMRKWLASQIRLHFPKPRGGKDPRSDVKFFMFVRGWCLQESFDLVARKLKRHTGTEPGPMDILNALPELGEPITVEDGLRHVIDSGAFGTTVETEINGLRKKFNRGKKLINGK